MQTSTAIATQKPTAIAAAGTMVASAASDQGEQHRSPTRNTPQPRAFRGTDA
jgi:hypothetical protein